MSRLTLFFSLLVLAVTGCAHSSGVLKVSDGVYMISRTPSTSFSGGGSAQAAAVKEATDFCQAVSGSFRLLQVEETAPPGIFDSYPQVNLRFRCFEAPVPRYA